VSGKAFEDQKLALIQIANESNMFVFDALILEDDNKFKDFMLKLMTTKNILKVIFNLINQNQSFVKRLDIHLTMILKA